MIAFKAYATFYARLDFNDLSAQPDALSVFLAKDTQNSVIVMDEIDVGLNVMTFGENVYVDDIALF